MKRICVFLAVMALGAGAWAASTNLPAPITKAVMVDTNGVLVAPTNFLAANAIASTGEVASVSERVTDLEDDTLEDLVARGGLVVSNPVTIDAANAWTNMFGGKITILGRIVIGGSGNTCGTDGAVFGYDNGAGNYSLGGGEGNTFNNWALGGGKVVTIGDYGVGGGYGNTIGEAALGGGEDVVVGDHGFGAGFHGISGPGSFLFTDYSSSEYFNRGSYTNEWGMRVQSIYWAIGNLTISAIEDTISLTDTAIPTSKAVMDYVDADTPLARMTNGLASATHENTTQGGETNSLVLLYFANVNGTNAVEFLDPRTGITNWFEVAASP